MKRTFIVLLLFSFLLIGIPLTYKYYQDYQEAQRQKILLEKRKAGWIALRQVLESQIYQFKGDLGIVIKDLDMKWEISFNQDKLFPSASLVKIPIMLAVLEAVLDGRINLKDTLQVNLANKVSGSGVLKNMPAGSIFSIEKLIELMISESDNTATNMLIDLLGFDYFNGYFKQLGLKNTNLSRKMMDFQYRKKGIENYTTAWDMAYILEKIYREEFLNSAVSKACLRLLKQQKIDDRIPKKLPVDTEVAHKTGLERNVCHDAGIVFTSKGDFLVCVLTKDTESSKVAKEFISNITLGTYNYYQQF